MLGTTKLLWLACVCTQLLQLCLTLCDPMTVTCLASLSMGLSRQEYWSGLQCPPPGDLPDPGIEPEFPVAPALQADSLPTELSAGDPGSIPGWGRSLEKRMANHSSILAWRMPWTEKPGRLLSMGHKELDTTEQLTD